jgi:tetratricopeptide (TPR) repeat protein
MRALVGLLALLLALPAGAQDKDKKKDQKKDDKKAADKVEKQVVGAAELAQQAEQKAAAGDVDGAVELLKKATTAAGAGGEVWLRLGTLLESKAELDVAMDAYQSAAEKLAGPAKAEALGRLAVIQELRGFGASATTADAAFAADPEGAWPLIARSRTLARQGKGDEAKELAEKAKGKDGGPPAEVALGFAHEARGDLAAAEAAYRGVVASVPGQMGASVGLARVLRKTGRGGEAEPLLQKVLEAAPGAVEAHKESARVRLALGRVNEAMENASIAAAMAENDPDAQRVLQQVTVAKALTLIGQGQVDTAVQDLTALRDQSPGAADVRLGLAKALIAKRQIDAALTELQKAVELDPALAEAHFQLGFLNQAFKGNPAAALGPYEKAVAAEPGNLEYRTNLGNVLAAVGQTDRGIAELTKVTQAPGYAKADAWTYLGGALLNAKRYKEAVPALEKAVSVAPDNELAYRYLAWTYFGLKDAEGFKKHGGRARALGTKDSQLLQYLGRVEKGEPIK